MNDISHNTRSEDIIVLKNVSKHFKLGGDTVKALDGATYCFKKGKMTAVVGKSGSGKSTILNLVGLLERPDSGEVFMEDLCINKLSEKRAVIFRREKIGFVFQSFNLIPNLTTIENVMLPLDFTNNKKRREKIKIASNLLNMVGVKKERFRHTPGKLSGGEQQRVAIARALVNNPEIILADEPTGNLDDDNGRKIIKILKDLTAEGKTVIIVTHDNTVREISDYSVRLHDGRIVI